ncbi:MAG: methyltransferase, partial [Gammaproteobacteria bacterium]|nr:methyltransferase [Gammaproteobacteria bacterium]
MAFGRLRRLCEQHSRNLAAGVAAAHRPEFDEPCSVVDIGGGSGTFAIPLAQRRADVSITLIELPRGVPNTRKFLRAHGVGDQVRILGFDVLKQPQQIPACDSIFIGNLIHDMGDTDCLSLFEGCYRALAAGDSMWVHERLWNDSKDGPLLTAQWHFIMMSHSREGKQRTAGEVEALMAATGFTPGRRIATTSGFTLVEGIREA